ncbi:MAG: hypothetical protein LBL07_14345 [Tannerella sp.]|jgi:hypothetical protein|nr:hypothetical protein [Tannerella sp.]
MKKNFSNYRLWLFIAIIAVSVVTGCSLSREKSVAVVLASDASPAVRSATEDLVASLNKVFPKDNFILEDNANISNLRRIEIAVDGQGTFESFRVTRANEDNVLRIAGADPLGAVYGVYALLEYYGCGFYMTYDTYPAPEKGRWRLPEKDFADAPLARERYSFNWHNFLSGCSGWDLAQWKSWIDQCRKMRYNVIMVHAYGNNPMFTFEYKGITKEAGVLASTDQGRDWGTPHVNDVRRMTGGEHFSGPVFAAPEGLLPAGEQVAAVQSMMKKVFAHAGAQGMKIAFQIDLDTDGNNPPEMMATLPDNAKIKVGGDRFRPQPDTPEGKAFYAAIINRLLGLYPEITSIVACTRSEPQPGYAVENFPAHWQKEYNDIKNEKLTNKARLAGYFWVSKAVKTIQEIVKETGYENVMVSQASWSFKWFPYADACSPKNVALLALDYDVVKNKPELDSPEGIQLLQALSSSGRRVVPIIWSHHDDGHYFGRTYTPCRSFASRLEEAGCDSYGIIHWLLRPHGLFFKSHSVQVWQSTKDQPLEETCRIMGRNLFGVKNEATGGAYLFDWITNAPIYGRETSDFMFDAWATNQPFSDEKLKAVEEDTKRRKALLAGIKSPSNIPAAAHHLAYWQGLEDFNLRMVSDETTLRNSINALKGGDAAKAAALLDKTDPAATIETYAGFASQLGLVRGDLGMLVLMNLKWYPAFVGQNQALGRESYRINFGPTVFEPLAQGSGNRSLHIDADKKFWLMQGARELKGRAWTLPESTALKSDGFSESEREIVRTGLAWADSAEIRIIPVMTSSFAPAQLKTPSGKPNRIKVYVNDISIQKEGDAQFDLLLNGATKLGTVTPKPGVAEILEFETPEAVTHITAVPNRGNVSLCGITVEQLK